MKYENKKGRQVIDMQNNPKFRGFDILSFSKNKKDVRAIEVKGTQKGGIPDLFETEVSRNNKLIATHLYVVKFNKEKKAEKLFVIPASAIKPEYLSKTLHYRICSNFQTKGIKKYQLKV